MIWFIFIQEIFLKNDFLKTKDYVRCGAETFLKEHYEDGSRIFAYFEDSIHGIVIRMKSAADHGVLHHIC